MPPSISTKRSPGRACLVLPQRLVHYAADRGLRALLARGALAEARVPASALSRVLDALGIDEPIQGQAALRYRGDTGDDPGGFIAAADPVWLQAGLDKLYLHALPPGDVSPAELERLFRDLQSELLAGSGQRLVAAGAHGYLVTREPLATADVPPAALDGERPDAFLPVGPGAATAQTLASEIQMSLHAHPLNAERESAGLRPLNALWLWGGGSAASVGPRVLPALHSDDALLKGYWQAAGQRVRPAPAGLADCLADGDFVASTGTLDEFATLWRSRSIARATLLFADGHRIDLARGLRALLRGRSRALERLVGDAR